MRRPASKTDQRWNRTDPNCCQGGQNVLIARRNRLFEGMLSTGCRVNLDRQMQLMSLREVSCAICSSGKYCTFVVEREPDMGRSCSTTGGRNPRPWAEEWSLKAVRWSPTAGHEVVGIAMMRWSYIVYPRHRS